MFLPKPPNLKFYKAKSFGTRKGVTELLLKRWSADKVCSNIIKQHVNKTETNVLDKS